MTIYSNKDGRSTIRGAFAKLSSGVKRIRLAAPFFSYADILKELGEQGCNIDLIVRLGPATPSSALLSAFEHTNVKIRYFTSEKFHTKLYVFGDSFALVGSANLTDSGLHSNHELALEVPQSHPDFDDLIALFQSYWNDADVLTKERLDSYEETWRDRSDDSSPDRKLESDIKERFGEIKPSGGINVGKLKPNANKLELEDYRRQYQDLFDAFREVEEIYASLNRQRQARLPLRIEIDQFLSYVRENEGLGDTYLNAPLREGDDRKNFIRDLVEQWFSQCWDYLDEEAERDYSVINNILGAEASIKKADYKSILDALDCCHAFRARHRFYSGGKPALHKEFQSHNDLEKTKRGLTHLIHGEGEFVDRMGALIFDPYWKLEMMGRSIVQEVYGWVKTGDAPICNDRTIKSLRYLGFDLV